MTRKIVLVGAFHEIVELCEACDVQIASSRRNDTRAEIDL